MMLEEEKRGGKFFRMLLDLVAGAVSTVPNFVIARSEATNQSPNQFRRCADKPPYSLYQRYCNGRPSLWFVTHTLSNFSISENIVLYKAK
jgi:hypothetical protein